MAESHLQYALDIDGASEGDISDAHGAQDRRGSSAGAWVLRHLADLDASRKWDHAAKCDRQLPESRERRLEGDAGSCDISDQETRIESLMSEAPGIGHIADRYRSDAMLTHYVSPERNMQGKRITSNRFDGS